MVMIQSDPYGNIGNNLGPLGIPGLVERIIGKISGKIGKTDFLFPKYNHLFKNSHNELIFQEGLST